jgi:hypothetical protein
LYHYYAARLRHCLLVKFETVRDSLRGSISEEKTSGLVFETILAVEIKETWVLGSPTYIDKRYLEIDISGMLNIIGSTTDCVARFKNWVSFDIKQSEAMNLVGDHVHSLSIISVTTEQFSLALNENHCQHAIILC